MAPLPAPAPLQAKASAPTDTPAIAKPANIGGWENPHAVASDVVVSGCAIGVPGTDAFLGDEAIDVLLEGTNLIGEVEMRDREAMVSKRMTRLVKGEGGGGEMVPVDNTDDVISLAGRIGAFDLTDFDVPDRVVDALDETSRLAFGAGLLALRDAGIPLVPRYRTTKSGKKITTGWTLPESLRDETAVIFGSAFSGHDALIAELTRSQDTEYSFDHRFLLKILGLAHARFAEFIGARGPNMRINTACASTTTGMALAQDWIRAGRCKRCIILGADNVTGDDGMMEWIGSGFLVTGAATTEDDVEQAALPFDRRRNGIILGAGAVAVVVEAAGLPESRGVEPIADLLATRIANSAEHPTRLDPDHIADEVGALVQQAEREYELDRKDFAARTVFVSHETYSPARGGSAQTEIESLRRTFGGHANEIVIANTKGFTGHSMGAGLEDVMALKALQRRTIPHIANFREPDPQLGDLRLSEGGSYDVDYALRLAAGFGSQLALALLRFRSRDEDRVRAPQRYEEWLRDVSGFEAPQLAVENRSLRLREGEPATDAASSDPAAPELPQTANANGSTAIGVSAVAEPRPAAHPERFEQLGVVVEAHPAPVYDLERLRARFGGRRVAVVSGPMVVTELVVTALERCGASVLVVEGKQSRSPLDVDTAVCDLTDEEAITRELNTFGNIDGVVNLLGFGGEQFGPSEVYRAARHSFHVARAWRQALGRTPVGEDFFLTITGMGGRLGFDRATGPLPVCGAVTGFTKALAREWAEATIRVLDVARRGFTPDLGLQLLWEGVFGTGFEIGLIGGVRYLPSTVATADITPEQLPSVAPTKEQVLLITGGAKGITAEVAFDLASRYGCALALVGRTPLDIEDPLAVDLAKAKADAKAEIEAKGERATPKAVRDALWSLNSQRVIAANVKRMRDAGSDVEYFACDVADAESVERVVAAVLDRFGRLDGVIHGAGVEESRLIEDKDIRGFDRVFRGKALGGLHLWNAAKDLKPSFFMTFSSVAGRFGNPGQVDYAAANEVLNKLVALLNATTAVRATSIDWTAWDEVGMASDGAMRMLLEARGVDLLPPEVGAPMVGDFLEAGLAGEFVVAGALGDFAAPSASDQSPAVLPDAPLCGRIVERDDDHVVVARTFSIEHDQFLADHVYEGNPVVPGVMGLEMMVETARQLVPDSKTAVVRDVLFEHAIKLHRNAPVELLATATRAADGTVTAEVHTKRETKTGRIVETRHFRATIELDAAPQHVALTLRATSKSEVGPQRDAIYERYFHEGTFQVLDDVSIVGEKFAIGHGRVGTRQLTRAAQNDAFLTDPMVREMAFQVAGLWGMVKTQMSYLPYSVQRCDTFAHARPGAPVSVRVAVREDADEHMIAVDVDVLDEDGNPLQRLERLQMVGHRKLTEQENFDALAAAPVRLRRLSATEAELELGRRGISFDDLVDAEERKAYDRLISDRRRREWQAARVATKSLVADWLRDVRGIKIRPTDVRIRKDGHGAPYVELDQGFDVAVLPAISITHSSGTAVAALCASREEGSVGIDLETAERRDEAFARNYFSEEELGLGDGLEDVVLHAALWSIKEAVAKALGIGLQARLDEIEIIGLTRVSDRQMRADVKLSGQATEAADRVGGSRLSVQVTLDSNTVLSQAILPFDNNSRATTELPQFERPQTENSDRAPLEIAAIAALLVHRGLLRERATSLDERSESEDLSAWKQ